MSRLKAFFSNFFKWGNIGTIAFFVLNFLVLVGLLGPSLGRQPGGLLFIALIYIGSQLLSFSPLGQALLRMINGARKMVRIDMRNRVLPIVEEVYAAAKKKTPTLPNKIRVRVMYGPEPNAFAIGTNTICVTEGMLDLSEDYMAGIIAHEMGHLALQHTVIQILIGGGNLIITVFMLILEAIRMLFTGVSVAGSVRGGGVLNWIAVLFSAISAGLIFLWTKICMLFLRSSSRANEYAADAYAYEIGYGEQLAEALDRLTMGTPQTPLLKILYNTHPEPSSRIGKLQSIGVTYSRY